jgi:type VI secretion system protein ImpK
VISTGWSTSKTEPPAKAPNQTDVQEGTVRLTSLFTELIAYVLFFHATSAESNIPSTEVRDKITSLIEAQEKRAKSEGFASEKYLEARRAVLSWVDEMILNSKWVHRTQWQHLMLKYYGTMNAGEDFFRHLETLSPEASDVREIYYLCLSLGFQGKYAFGDGPKQIQELRQSLYRQLPVSNGFDQLFPEAYQEPQARPQKKPRRLGLLWYGLVFLVPAVLFIVCWSILGRRVEEKMAWLEKNPLPKEAPEVPNVARQLSLVDELVARGFDARQISRGVAVILSGLFGANDTSLNARERRKIEEIALAVKLRAPNRSVLVEGHSSVEGNVETNEQLSKDRARLVADFLKLQGIDKVRWEGRGSRFPFEDPRRSRRVEIIIEDGSESTP